MGKTELCVVHIIEKSLYTVLNLLTHKKEYRLP